MERGDEGENGKDGEEGMDVQNASSGVIEALMEGDVNIVNGKKDRKKKRKTELDEDEEKSEKVEKKRKKVLVGDDFAVKEEASKETAVDVVENLILENKDKKKEEKKKKKKDGVDVIESSDAIDDDNEEADKDKKKRKKKKNKDENDAIRSNNVIDDSKEEAGEDKKNGNKKKKKKSEGEIDAIGSSNATDDGNEEAEKDKKKKKKKKPESGGDDLEVEAHNEGVEANNQSGNSSSKGKSKRVRFADQLEVFPSSDDKNLANENKKGEFVRGKRFSKEEDDKLEEAVKEYIDVHGLGEEGLNKVLYSKSHPEVRNCWKEIGKALPWRHTSSVYHRAHILFERDENRKWSSEEYEMIRKYVEKRGNKWKALAGALGKHRIHVKDAWRRTKLENRKKGRWSQDEYQSLFDLVNLDLCMKANEEKKSKHGMLRDNICWEAISDKMTTRAFSSCCSQWYYKLASPMVAEGKWADADDYRMLDALSSLDACCMEDVDWDNLLKHRSGDVCRKRWSQMVQHIGHHGSQSFPEQVETLANRYRPDMLEVRETLDTKPYADEAE